MIEYQSNSKIATPGHPPAPRPKSFYRPELDALRFFAFAAVLVHHGPDGPFLFEVAKMAGAFGLSMFFMLSAYLITELLLRERDHSGTISWKLFFVRRALRIWPLYYAALGAGLLVGRLYPVHGVNRIGAATMAVFLTNWFQGQSGLGLWLGLLAPLWSISVEEQFYLIWPPIIRAGGETFVVMASIFFAVCSATWLWVYAPNGWRLWFDTPVEFLFFGTGAIIAVLTRGSKGTISRVSRIALSTVGLIFLGLAAGLSGIGTNNVAGLTLTKLYGGYFLAAAGCASMFLAFLGIRDVPKPLTYLGKISYGLYVFHLGALALATWFTARFHLPNLSAINMITVDTLGLLICIPLAHISYQYFEKPFLNLKQRFEVVHSRPV